jgi:4-oxalocrotonate tautomerase
MIFSFDFIIAEDLIVPMDLFSIYASNFRLTVYPGRTKEQKEEFAKAITEAAVEILKAKVEHIIVVYDEKPKENWVYFRKTPLIVANYFILCLDDHY